MSEAHRVIYLADEPTGTHTQYLINYDTGSTVVDVHGLLGRWSDDEDGDITGIMLIVNDKESPVWVDVQEISGREFEIYRVNHIDEAVERVRYADATQVGHEDPAVEADEVFIEGFKDIPHVPEV